MHNIKKIFWALWGPSLRGVKITKNEVDSLNGLSRKIHDTRLRGLYVDLKNEGPILPRDAVTTDETQMIIDAAYARLEFEKLQEFVKINDNNLGKLNWFLAVSDDKEKRRLIFGSKSMAKLAELEDVHNWIAWLKEQFDSADKEAQDFARQELQRKPPTEGIEANKDKWKIKIRYFTNSHSIRPKALNSWNSWSSWIKLYPVGGKKNQFTAEFTLPRRVTGHTLWWAGWSASRRFITALNIGTMGSFWWYVPEQVSHYYEKIIDLEQTNIEMRIERSPALKIDWGNRALTESDLRYTAMCFGMMPAENESELGRSMGAYITGLSFLNKTDIHIQFEANTFEFFYKSLKHGTTHFKEWTGETPFTDTFEKILIDTGFDNHQVENYRALSAQFEGGKPSFEGLTLTLSEVGMMKALCDKYFLFKFIEIAKQRRNMSEKA